MKYGLPDQGFAVIRWAHDLYRGGGAVAVERDVQRIRRPDGGLAYADTAAFRTVHDGPLAVLRQLLDVEARTVGSWSRAGFTRLRRRSAGRRAERICRESGSEAAVDWTLANATDPEALRLDELRDRLGPRLAEARGRDADFYRAQVRRCIDERRRRRLPGA